MNNPALNRLPQHLKKYIVDQRYQDYTPIDHSVWRYIMRQAVNFLGKHAHSSYIEGLKKTGISTEYIPNIDEMNERLAKIGWGAVCVDGFIPPNAFMEFQAYNVLVIAADIRHINHIEYTPAPDIVHEAAGHAPIIAHPEYAEYLRLFGEIGSKALSSQKDNELYEAIRRLSILKESPNSTQEEVNEAEKEVLNLQNNLGELSEMAKIRNLHWWTVEYGLIGDVNNPKLYGAGLLSSIGESMECLQDTVKKIPYSTQAVSYSFDITTQQPQLFVTPDFSYLTMVLNEFADTMALRKGGAEGVEKAIASNSFATIELDSGVQISGKFTELIKDQQGNVAFIKTNGPSLLCEHEQLLIGHGTEYHNHGYSTPVGRIVGFDRPFQSYRLSELKTMGIETSKRCKLKYESGIEVEGIVHSFRKNKYGNTLLISFDDCTVTNGKDTLFQPEWGVFDLAVGVEVRSVFAGSADKDEYDPDGYISPTTTIRDNNHDPELLKLYAKVRKYRQNKLQKEQELIDIFLVLKQHYQYDWLLSLEILELLQKDSSSYAEVYQFLLSKSKEEGLEKLISNGLKLIV
jgi:phenylalanine-4-hydroxylase